jgi:hypothetical protein
VTAIRRHTVRVHGCLIVALLCGGLVALAGPASGQQRMVISGFVQWISGSDMQMVADNGVSIRVNLDNAAQSDYNTLRNGDRIRVFGYVSPDRSELIAERIDRSDAPNVYDSYTPYPQTP